MSPDRLRAMDADERRRRLLALRERDQAKRQELARRSELWQGYHAEMEQVHRENARALEALLDAGGWPGASQVGEDGAAAAWLVAVHAIGEPAFQRRCLTLLERALAQGEARPEQRAALVDRIRYNERRPQVYGTIFDWDADGRMSPWQIEDPDGVEQRRREVGLPPLAESVREVRERTRREAEQPPQAYAERQAEILAWARRVGWVVDV